MSLPDLPGLVDALCALAFYRHRHDTRQVYKTGRRSTLRVKVNRADYVAVARKHIRRARAAGWRGSIRQARSLPISPGTGRTQLT